MTILTDSEINLALATHFGLPVTTFTDCNEYHAHSTDCGVVSVKPDFIHDPAMRDYLQEKLLEAGWTFAMCPPITYGPYKGEVKMTLSAYQKPRMIVRADREHVWALAAYRALVEGE